MYYKLKPTVREKRPYWSYSGPHFLEFGNLPCELSYSFQMRENVEKKNLQIQASLTQCRVSGIETSHQKQLIFTERKESSKFELA